MFIKNKKIKNQTVSNIIIISSFLMVILNFKFAFAKEITALTKIYDCNKLSTDSESAEFKAQFEDFKKICKNPTVYNSKREEQFMKILGSNICDDLFSNIYNTKLQCTYYSIIQSKILNTAQAMAISAYTGHYYNQLKPNQISIRQKAKGYTGIRDLNYTLIDALRKLRKYPQYQHSGDLYRGSKTSGHEFKGIDLNQGSIFKRSTWMSTSCTAEIAFGPKTVDLNFDELKSLKKDFELVDIDDTNVNGQDSETQDAYYQMQQVAYKRDPETLPKVMNDCQKTYYTENPKPSLSAEANFGQGDLEIVIKPLPAGRSRGVKVYEFSDRRNEAEILYPPGVTFKIIERIEPQNNPSGDTKIVIEEQD